MKVIIWYDGIDVRAFDTPVVPRVGDRIAYPPDERIPGDDDDGEGYHSLVVARVVWLPWAGTGLEVWLYCEWGGPGSDDMDGLDWRDELSLSRRKR